MTGFSTNKFFDGRLLFQDENARIQWAQTVYEKSFLHLDWPPLHWWKACATLEVNLVIKAPVK